jgi:hypothetical protein
MSSCYSFTNISCFSNKSNLLKKVSNKYDFIPLKDKSYDLIYEKSNENQKIGPCYKQVKFNHLLYENNTYPWIEIECFSILKSNKKNRIIVLRIKNKNIIDEYKNTIIFSHEDNSDLGTKYPFLVDLATQMKVILFTCL